MRKLGKILMALLLAICLLTSAVFPAMHGWVPAAKAAILGDVNGDRKVTAADARLVLRAAVGLNAYAQGSDQFTAADVNQDGRITASDARIILRAAVGIENLNQKSTAAHRLDEWIKANGTYSGGTYHYALPGIDDLIYDPGSSTKTFTLKKTVSDFFTDMLTINESFDDYQAISKFSVSGSTVYNAQFKIEHEKLVKGSETACFKETAFTGQSDKHTSAKNAAATFTALALSSLESLNISKGIGLDFHEDMHLYSWEAANCNNGHTWDSGVITLQPTAYTDGEKVFTCKVCGATKQVTVRAYGNASPVERLGEWVITNGMSADGKNKYELMDDMYLIYQPNNTDAAFLISSSKSFGSFSTNETLTINAGFDHYRIAVSSSGILLYSGVYSITHEKISRNGDNHEYLTEQSFSSSYSSRSDVKDIAVSSAGLAITLLTRLIDEQGIPVDILQDMHLYSWNGEVFDSCENGHSWDSGVVTAQPTATATGIRTYTCSVCGTTKTETIPATGHNVSDKTLTVDQDVISAHNNEVIRPCFNSMVNTIVEGKYLFSKITKTESNGDVTDSNIVIPDDAKLMFNMIGGTSEEEDFYFSEEGIVNMLKEGLADGATVYSNYMLKSPYIFNYYPLPFSNTVSELTASDVKSIKEEQVGSIDFLSEIPETIHIQQNNYNIDQDMREFLALGAVTGRISKVTVELKDEAYSAIKDSAEDTALMHATGVDIRNYVSGFSQTDEEQGMLLKMDCREVTTKCTVTYYFQQTEDGGEVKYTPIASKYATAYVVKQHVEIKAATPLDELGVDSILLNTFLRMTGLKKGDELVIAEGTVDLNTNITTTDYYLLTAAE